MDDNQNRGLIGDVIAWIGHPFNSQGDALSWILFVGLLIIAAWFWNHVLLMLQNEI